MSVGSSLRDLGRELVDEFSDGYADIAALGFLALTFVPILLATAVIAAPFWFVGWLIHRLARVEEAA